MFIRLFEDATEKKREAPIDGHAAPMNDDDFSELIKETAQEKENRRT